MNIFDIEKLLKNITILYDTREQPTEKLKRRISQFGCPAIRKKLDYGDYSIKCSLSDTEEISLENKVVIERKMNIDELAMCMGKERKRFEAEFERSVKDGAKVYLLVENGSMDKILRHDYTSRMNSKALIASLCAWMPRYNMIPIFCTSQNSGKIIKEILFRELKEHLVAYGEEKKQQGLG